MTTEPPGHDNNVFASPDAVNAALEDHGYLVDVDVSNMVFLASKLDRPMFLEGEPGCGKTFLARALAAATGRELVQLQCYAGVDANAALYEWDFTAQVLHLRSIQQGGDAADSRGDRSIYSRRFLETRPLLRSLENPHTVLLIDEVDRADEAFEAVLLQYLSDYSITVPHLGQISTASADVRPLVILTSNRTRDVHDALKRRCLYHYFRHPDRDRQLTILLRRFEGLSVVRARAIVDYVDLVRATDLLRPPGLSEIIDFTQALTIMGTSINDDTQFRMLAQMLIKDPADEAALAGITVPTTLLAV
ncbi:MoxR family ATPase [Rhodococcus sp. IEGM 1366]|uniref:AAA family ATPase n=1 Tax=Rhodococcus sp. IEGM 1366 TaxID=3082223 RepID=UPI0029544F26|nr:MoxR family ATPase [Rhodococcus sp. IEGM 1366]MDV8070749.1 MoxR family ATPase [Rhodococcus sp. IEGM 1366]